MLPTQVFVSTCKRKRGPNWIEKEKNVLVDEYKRRRHILRPRGPGLTTVVERETAWDEICAALKAVSGPYVKRDVVDVRKKWDNLCFWAKKCIAEWKDKHNSVDGAKGLNGDNTPPALALKILAIYQEEWAELFPNAQVVDGGDVFFVLNNVNHNQAEVPAEEASNSNLVDDGNGDEYQVIDSGPEANNVKPEEDVDDRWQQDIDVVHDDEGFQTFPTETSSQSADQPPVSYAHQPLSQPHFQRHPLPPCAATPSPPLENDSLPRSSSPSATTTTAHSSRFNPYQLHSSMPTNSSHQYPHRRSLLPRGASPAYKRKRYTQVMAEDSAHSDMDDEKDIETLSKDLLILRKEKIILEKQKLEIEKEKLVIERDILDMQRERQWLQLEKDRLGNGQNT